METHRKTVYLQFALPLLLVLGALINPVVSFSAEPCRIKVSKNAMITGAEMEKGRVVWETFIAVNPRNRNNLLATGHSEGPNNKIYTVFYFSMDGAKTWAKTRLLGFDGKPIDGIDGADPVVAFDKAGTAYLFTMAKTNIGNLVQISYDGGRTATLPKRINNLSVDHPMPAADLTNGPYAGRVYAFGMSWDLSTKTGRKLALFRTASGGKDWSGFEILNSKASGLVREGEKDLDTGINSENNGLLISSTGKLFFFIRSWNAKRSEEKLGWSYIFNTSDDGGDTYSPANRIRAQDESPLIEQNVGSAAFGIDASNGRFKDRLYAAWIEEGAEGIPQLWFARSTNEGKTWEPKRIDAQKIFERTNRLYQKMTHPVITVNHQGIILLSFYNFRVLGEIDPPSDGGVGVRRTRPMSFQRYVTASTDGGETFLSVTPLASEESRFTSRVASTGEESPSNPKQAHLNDYLNDVAGPDGTFHAQWMDGRVGVQQMWYASVNVRCGRNK